MYVLCSKNYAVFCKQRKFIAIFEENGVFMLGGFFIQSIFANRNKSFQNCFIPL